jgi:thioredoxin reductase (NADPH)
MNNRTTVVLYGADWSSDSHRLKFILDKHNINYVYKNTDEPVNKTKMLTLTDNELVVPTLVIDKKVLKNPDNSEIFQALDIADVKISTHTTIMIGAGPASLAAAIYTTREDIETLLFERGVIGGLAAITDKIDNYPGFVDGIPGLTLAEDLQKQAERFGAVIELGEVTKLNDEGKYIHLETTSGDMYAKTVLIATGTDYKKIGIPGEKEYYARGVHYCATCDGAFYRDKRLVVVGGGNSAVQESLFLTKFASHIDLLVRGESFRASEILQKELKEKYQDKITVHFNTSTDEIIGSNGQVTKVIGTDKTTNRKVEFPTDGVFVFAGLIPNTQFLQDSNIELDQVGFIKTNERLETAIPGVFAAGDVRSGATMQIASATGEGATAALHIREYLSDLSKTVVD